MIDKLLRQLEEAQRQHAVTALKHPSAKTEFEYGQRCGYMEGLERALELTLQLLRDERAD